MYRFKRLDGKDVRIYFFHVGGKKGEKFEKGKPCKPGKAPRYTKCTIVDANNVLISSGTAAPLAAILEELPEGFTEKIAQKFYGRRFKRITVKSDGKAYVVLKGDTFSRAEGRKQSLKKALAALPKKERVGAWEAVGEIVVEPFSDID